MERSNGRPVLPGQSDNVTSPCRPAVSSPTPQRDPPRQPLSPEQEEFEHRGSVQVPVYPTVSALFPHPDVLDAAEAEIADLARLTTPHQKVKLSPAEHAARFTGILTRLVDHSQPAHEGHFQVWPSPAVIADFYMRQNSATTTPPAHQPRDEQHHYPVANSLLNASHITALQHHYPVANSLLNASHITALLHGWPRARREFALFVRDFVRGDPEAPEPAPRVLEPMLTITVPRFLDDGGGGVTAGRTCRVDRAAATCWTATADDDDGDDGDDGDDSDDSDEMREAIYPDGGDGDDGDDGGGIGEDGEDYHVLWLRDIDVVPSLTAQLAVLYALLRLFHLEHNRELLGQMGTREKLLFKFSKG
ncbi:hypothetical protein B0T26DRAFT_676671 [Lasiosphaeria miniovina]|uniref:Uncharacterized protein n=1 Tax=Lasiosphaeria miniovina TaxID=1954250 RepID=A0AA40AMD4_9PEZI|nr:uncharacterized protein B0T26DRAFT_676671 [Lasiosphaeria miniovina]KAK0718516.1 hypothetical protein B0T26DRAFT_676671 [Lasiosphaeria miniovina]